MATTAATASHIATTIRTFPLTAYFVLAYALSWLILVPAGFGLLSDGSAGVLSHLPPFGPAAAALIYTEVRSQPAARPQNLRRTCWFLPAS